MAGIKNGELIEADELMNSFGTNFNDTAQNIFNADYIGFDSMLSNSGVPSLKNVFYSTFTSDDADTKTGFKYYSADNYYALHLTDEASGDTTHDPDSFTNPSNAFDGDNDTNASKSFVDTATTTVYLGKTFSSKDVEAVYYKVGISESPGNGSWTDTVKLQWYNGSVWADISGTALSIERNGINEGYFHIDLTGIQGIRVYSSLSTGDGNSDTTHRVYSLEYGDGITEGTLIFKDTASTDNAIAVINSQIDATSSEQISISADGGSNYTDVNNTEIARPTSGSALWRKIVITRTDLSKLDKVTEQAVKYEFY